MGKRGTLCSVANRPTMRAAVARVANRHDTNATCGVCRRHAKVDDLVHGHGRDRRVLALKGARARSAASLAGAVKPQVSRLGPAELSTRWASAASSGFAPGRPSSGTRVDVGQSDGCLGKVFGFGGGRISDLGDDPRQQLHRSVSERNDNRHRHKSTGIVGIARRQPRFLARRDGSARFARYRLGVCSSPVGEGGEFRHERAASKKIFPTRRESRTRHAARAPRCHWALHFCHDAFCSQSWTYDSGLWHTRRTHIVAERAEKTQPSHTSRPSSRQHATCGHASHPRALLRRRR